MRRISRRTLMALSIALSLFLHGTLIAMAPRLPLMRAQAAPKSVLDVFRVRLRDDIPPPPPPPPAGRDTEKGGDLASRPGTIEDLLTRETENLKPETQSAGNIGEVPQLKERVAAEIVPREHHLQQSDDIQRGVDAKIIEISETIARQDIEVTRRLVTPSPARFISDDELPTVRSEVEAMTDEVLLINPLRSGAASGLPGGETSAPPVPLVQEGILEPVEPMETPGLPELPLETALLRPRIEAAIAKENPYEFMDELLAVQLDTYIPPNQQKGFFRVVVAPIEGGTVEVLPKDITFVVDASNSILQRKLDATVQGVVVALTMLKPEDRFNIVVFRDSPTMFRPATVAASPDAKAAAKSFLINLQSHGETDIYSAVQSVLETKPRDDVPAIVMVLSDGRPTTGMRDSRTIINDLTLDNRSRSTIVAFGGGKTVNRYLLDLLAYRNKGESYVAPSIEKIGGELPSFLAKFGDPILADCQANYGHIDQVNIFPKQLPDFFKGKAVTVYGQFDQVKDREFVMRLTGKAGAKKKETIFKADFRKAGVGDVEIARNWAFRKIYFIIGEMCRVGETPELLSELRQLSRQYQIRTTYDE